jgi:dienelactone hydrolase
MTEVTISTPHHRLKGYVAMPRGDGTWPGVIVLHDIFSLTDVTRQHADWLAKEGYLAVAPDLFSWGGRLRCIRALMVDLSARNGAAPNARTLARAMRLQLRSVLIANLRIRTMAGPAPMNWGAGKPGVSIQSGP